MNNKIRELRKKQQVTISKLAKELNVSERSITSYEVGTRDLSTENLKKLANIFNCSIDYILMLTDIKSLNEHKEYIDVLSKAINKGLTPTHLDKIINIWLEAKDSN
ncbi:MAG: helix-turn-helix transcriptional regulator [Clostridiales bacterium]